MNLLRRLLAQSRTSLVRAACWLSLGGLAVMCVSIVFPRPLTVIFAMSVGHVIGLLAIICYLIAVILDITSRSARSSGVPPSPQAAEPASKSGS